jgi:hypothetical protein
MIVSLQKLELKTLQTRIGHLKICERKWVAQSIWPIWRTWTLYNFQSSLLQKHSSIIQLANFWGQDKNYIPNGKISNDSQKNL